MSVFDKRVAGFAFAFVLVLGVVFVERGHQGPRGMHGDYYSRFRLGLVEGGADSYFVGPQCDVSGYGVLKCAQAKVCVCWIDVCAVRFDYTEQGDREVGHSLSMPEFLERQSDEELFGQVSRLSACVSAGVPYDDDSDVVRLRSVSASALVDGVKSKADLAFVEGLK